MPSVYSKLCKKGKQRSNARNLSTSIHVDDTKVTKISHYVSDRVQYASCKKTPKLLRPAPCEREVPRFRSSDMPYNDDNFRKLVRTFNELVALREGKVGRKTVNTFMYRTSNFVGGMFDYRGGELSLAEGEIRLLVTPGAIEPGEGLKPIYMYLPLKRRQYPSTKMKLKGISLSPVICCGQHGMTFKKPVLLSIKSAIDGDVNAFQVLRSDTQPDEKPDWRVATPNEVHCVWNNGYCTVAFTHFTLYQVIGMHGETIVKGRFLVQVYLEDRGGATPIVKLRVHVFPETEACALIVKNQEAELGGKLVDAWQRLSIEEYKGATIELSDFGGWIPINKTIEHVKSTQIWVGEPAGVSRTFTLKKHIQSGAGDGRIEAKVTVYETGKPSTSEYIHVLNENLAIQHGGAQPGQPDLQTKQRKRLVSSVPDPSPGSDREFRNSLPEIQHAYQEKFANVMPYELYADLCIKLDIKRWTDGDGRYLAENLGLSGEVIQYLTHNVSEQPRSLTAAVLDFFLVNRLQRGLGKDEILEELRHRLLEIKHEVAAELVEKYITIKPTSADSGRGSSLKTPASRAGTKP